MRATRSNEIYNRFGAFKESQWIGHSTQVAKDHYLMIQDTDYLEAALWEIPQVAVAITPRQETVPGRLSIEKQPV